MDYDENQDVLDEEVEEMGDDDLDLEGDDFEGDDDLEDMMPEGFDTDDEE